MIRREIPAARQPPVASTPRPRSQCRGARPRI